MVEENPVDDAAVKQVKKSMRMILPCLLAVSILIISPMLDGGLDLFTYVIFALVVVGIIFMNRGKQNTEGTESESTKMFKKDLMNSKLFPAKKSIPIVSSSEMHCPFCGAPVSVRESKCPKCKKSI